MLISLENFSKLRKSHLAYSKPVGTPGSWKRILNWIFENGVVMLRFEVVWVVVWKAADDKSEELTPIRWLIVLPPEIWSSIYQEATSPCYNPLPVIPSMVDTEIDTLTRKKPGASKLTSTKFNLHLQYKYCRYKFNIDLYSSKLQMYF